MTDAVWLLLAVCVAVRDAVGVRLGVMLAVGVRLALADGHAGGNMTARYAWLVCSVVTSVEARDAVLRRHTCEKSRAGADTAYRKKTPPSTRPATLNTGSVVANRWEPTLSHFHSPVLVSAKA